MPDVMLKVTGLAQQGSSPEAAMTVTLKSWTRLVTACSKDWEAEPLEMPRDRVTMAGSCALEATQSRPATTLLTDPAYACSLIRLVCFKKQSLVLDSGWETALLQVHTADMQDAADLVVYRWSCIKGSGLLPGRCICHQNLQRIANELAAKRAKIGEHLERDISLMMACVMQTKCTSPQHVHG